jgi:hypothetical protein
MQPAAEVARLRKTMEDTEREVTERLKASEAEHRQSNEKALALSDSSTGKIRAELDSMTAAQRNHACTDRRHAARGTERHGLAHGES